MTTTEVDKCVLQVVTVETTAGAMTTLCRISRHGEELSTEYIQDQNRDRDFPAEF